MVSRSKWGHDYDKQIRWMAQVQCSCAKQGLLNLRY